jgi:hypothetical protein
MSCIYGFASTALGEGMGAHLLLLLLAGLLLPVVMDVEQMVYIFGEFSLGVGS